MRNETVRVVGIIGATGFIGAALAEHLEGAGVNVVRFSRSPNGRGPGWRPLSGAIDLSGLDAVVNLAGESVAQRWSSGVRERLRTSRIDLTGRIVEAMGAMPSRERPRRLLNASAVGYYGSGGDALLDERAAAGNGFLAELCIDWEAEALKAESLGVRVVLLRTGVVLGDQGEAWQRLWRVFRLGLGGVLGNGRQWMPWIHLLDELRAIEFLLETEDVSGAFNLSAPAPVTNREFTETLARLARRPAIFRMPAPVLKALLGGFGGTLIASARVVPTRLQEHHFPFQFPDLLTALKDLCKT